MNQWINSDKDTIVSYVTENVRGADENAVGALYDVAMSVSMFPTDPASLLDTDVYQGLADLLYEGGEIDTQLDAGSFIDRSYLEKAAGMGCGTA